MGLEIKGLWLVDFDSGAGYYCWKYPESSLGHFHGYDEGFSGRVPSPVAVGLLGWGSRRALRGGSAGAASTALGDRPGRACASRRRKAPPRPPR